MFAEASIYFHFPCIYTRKAAGTLNGLHICSVMYHKRRGSFAPPPTRPRGIFSARTFCSIPWQSHVCRKPRCPQVLDTMNTTSSPTPLRSQFVAMCTTRAVLRVLALVAALHLCASARRTCVIDCMYEQQVNIKYEDQRAPGFQGDTGRPHKYGP